MSLSHSHIWIVAGSQGDGTLGRAWAEVRRGGGDAGVRQDADVRVSAVLQGLQTEVCSQRTYQVGSFKYALQDITLKNIKWWKFLWVSLWGASNVLEMEPELWSGSVNVNKPLLLRTSVFPHVQPQNTVRICTWFPTDRFLIDVSVCFCLEHTLVRSHTSVRTVPKRMRRPAIYVNTNGQSTAPKTSRFVYVCVWIFVNSYHQHHRVWYHLRRGLMQSHGAVYT